jgi:hypothetical protein
MKDRSKRIRLALGIALFSLLVVYPVIYPYDTLAQLPCLSDGPSIENTGENNPLTDDQNREKISASIIQPESSFVAVSVAENLSYLYSQTPPASRSGSILRC